ncbi:hypothetical protein QE152_g6568 [Popillia japonica]|uniref:Protein SERAC1 n=1 Tax=Popillia japonica TaxID=7064 RepID=A0AAW1MIR2_POPJA
MPFQHIGYNRIKYISFIAVSSGIFWITIQVRKTRERLNGAFDSYIVHLIEPQNNKNDVVKIEFDAARWVKASNSDETFHQRIWRNVKFAYAKRLLHLTTAANKSLRWKATKYLARIKDLHNWQYSLLANECDSRTAIALARVEGVDSRYFVQPPGYGVICNQDYLVHILKDFLMHLENSSKHPCITNFISNSFADVQEMGKVFENYYDHTDHLAKCVKSTTDVLPLCLESILHHSTIERFAKDIVQQNGLYLLMEIYKTFKDVYEINVALCTILSNMSIYPDLLDEIHKSGWIGILSQWARVPDMRLSVVAGRALANLDKDDQYKAKYEKGIYSLHPVLRTDQQTKVDVVIVHGLLGGVFYTWRQRQNSDLTLSIIETITSDTYSKIKCSSDPVMREYLATLEEQKQMEWDSIGNDFEIISYDIPTNANSGCDCAFVCNGYSNVCCNDSKTTQCWPKDWLTKDCQNLRVIGINYDTSLSKWATTCPEEGSKVTLDERTNELINKLKRAGVGNRPIIWITHSMGGLLVKNLLCKAYNCHDTTDRFLRNTKAIVFYSTPHNGSRIANLNSPTSYVVLPSVEVQELREESPHLKRMHQEFLDIMTLLPVKVISFVETKSTVVTAMKFNFLMVKPESGNAGIGEYYEIPQDHLGICKPVNRESFLYQKVLHLVKEVVETT